MTPFEMECLADLLVERVIERLAPLTPDALIDADEVARRLGVDRDYVYRHAAKLGARRLGDGERARLRFLWRDVAEALPCLRNRGSGEAESPESRSRSHGRRRRSPMAAPLVPIRGALVPKPLAEDKA